MELEKLLQSIKLTPLDVRSKIEHLGKRLPGAVHIPIQHLEDRVMELSEDKVYLVYCEHGMRSGQACEILVESGIPKRQIINLKDGLYGYRGYTEGDIHAR